MYKRVWTTNKKLRKITRTTIKKQQSKIRKNVQNNVNNQSATGKKIYNESNKNKRQH